MIIDGPQDGVTWLTFDRPERLNAFTAHDYSELRGALERCADDDGTRVVVLSGRGRAFSAGADRSLLDPDLDRPSRDRASEEFALIMSTLGTFPKPLLAAVNGLAVGVGCTMLLYCDLVMAASSARFRLPFTALGLVPEAGSSALLPTRVRMSDAMWAVLSSEWIDASAAQDMGLVWRVAPDDTLNAEVAAAAATIAAHDPASVAATKRLMTAGRADAARMAMERELEAMRSLSTSKETR